MRVDLTPITLDRSELIKNEKENAKKVTYRDVILHGYRHPGAPERRAARSSERRPEGRSEMKSEVKGEMAGEAEATARGTWCRDRRCYMVP
jgi:hypothetical protein